MAGPTKDVRTPITPRRARPRARADTHGNVYGGEVVLKNLRKYVPE